VFSLAVLMLIIAAPGAAGQGLQDALDAPRSIEAYDSVWIEELTWMEVRDLLAEGKTTAIIPTGGIEQNGPYVATGKHNYVLQSSCPAIARALGNALCAPIVKLVPEVTDVASSLRVHGFRHIVFIGDSGSNTDGMVNVAAALNERWTDATAHHIPEYYRYGGGAFLRDELGIEETENDGIHDSFGITSLMMVTDPTVVRYDQRVKAGLAKINGVPIAPKEKTVEIGKKLLEYRANLTADRIRASIAAAGER
jgi:creatinine amidohydrolase/Fe(II)-dependent formamide hydrolase-like protein